jgi:Fe-S cluster assembly iron-binding protein IscA
MLQVTDSALDLLRDALVNERTEDSQVFRLLIRDDEFVIGLDEMQADDVAFDHDGDTVLAAPQDIANMMLTDTTIDLETTPEGPKLVLVT